MTLPPEVLQQRYAAIELAYSEQNWSQAEDLSAALLAELPDVAGAPLRQRLLLLLGHTRLYGMADTAAARQHYGAVLSESDEATLREIAEQGLEQCLALEQPTSTAAAPAAETAGPAASDAGSANSGDGEIGAATPWLQQLGSGSPQVAPSAAAETALDAMAGGDAAPWLQQPATGEPGRAEPAPAGDAVASGETRDAALSLAKGAPAPREPEETTASEAAALAVEIVEEPEQIAVAQADPQRREELELQEPLAVGPSRGEDEIPAAAQEAPLSDALMEEFSRNLLRLRLG